MSSIAIKGASGLGDTIYLYPIAKHFSTLYDTVHLMSDYPELFESLPKVKCFPHKKLNYIPLGEGKKQPIDLRCTYGPRKHKPGTSQFEDMLIFGKHSLKGQNHPHWNMPELELKIDWSIKNEELVRTTKAVAKGRKICVVAAPYEPFGREDEWGAVLRIKPEVIQDICTRYRESILFITIGNKYTLHRPTVEHDLVEQTTVSDLMDLVSISDICLSQIGNLLPMAEALGKKNFIVFAEGIKQASHPFISSITPQKTIHFKHLNKSVYDSSDNITESFYDHFCK